MITFDFSGYWEIYGILLIAMAGFWGFKRFKALISGR